jgi:tetratricopeptide (TPR) repeat protein
LPFRIAMTEPTEAAAAIGDDYAYPRLSSRERLRRILVCSLIPILAIAAYLEYPDLKAEYHFYQAEKARQRRDFAEARRHLQINLAADPASARNHFLLARVARQSAAFEEAAQHLQDCEKWEGGTARINLERVLLEAQQGATSRSTEDRLRIYVQEGHPESREILEALSAGCLITNRFGPAQSYLTKWIELSPDCAQAYIWRSLARERLSGFADARDDARQAVALAPASFDARLRLGQTLLLTTEYQESAEVLEPLYQEYPQNLVVGMSLAQAESKLGRLEDTAQILDALLARFPGDASILMERGRLALSMGDDARGESWLKQAVAQAPWDYQTNYSLLQVLVRSKKDQEAKALEAKLRRIEQDSVKMGALNDRFKSDPYDLGVRCEIARLYLDQGNDKEALDWLQGAVKVDPGHPLANQMLAEYYEKIHEPAQAAKYRAAAGQ